MERFYYWISEGNTEMPQDTAIENYARTNLLSRGVEIQTLVSSGTERETRLARKATIINFLNFFVGSNSMTIERKSSINI